MLVGPQAREPSTALQVPQMSARGVGRPSTLAAPRGGRLRVLAAHWLVRAARKRREAVARQRPVRVPAEAVGRYPEQEGTRLPQAVVVLPEAKSIRGDALPLAELALVVHQIHGRSPRRRRTTAAQSAVRRSPLALFQPRTVASRPREMRQTTMASQVISSFGCIGPKPPQM